MPFKCYSVRITNSFITESSNVPSLSELCFVLLQLIVQPLILQQVINKSKQVGLGSKLQGEDCMPKMIKIGPPMFVSWSYSKKLEIRSVERGICPIATLYSLVAAFQHLTLL